MAAWMPLWAAPYRSIPRVARQPLVIRLEAFRSRIVHEGAA